MKNLEYYEVYENSPEGFEISMASFLHKDDAIGFATNKGMFGLAAHIKLKSIILYESREEAEKFFENRRPIKRIGGFSHVH